MYDTSGTQSVCYATHPDYDVNARLKWLKGELALARTWTAEMLVTARTVSAATRVKSGPPVTGAAGAAG